MTVKAAPFRLARQQSLVNSLADLTRQADAGEVLAMVCLYMDENGKWAVTQDFDERDRATVIGELRAAEANLVYEHMTGRSLLTPTKPKDNA